MDGIVVTDFLVRSFFELRPGESENYVQRCRVLEPGSVVPSDQVVVIGDTAEYLLCGHRIATWNPVHREAVIGIPPEQGDPFFYEDLGWGLLGLNTERVSRYFGVLRYIFAEYSARFGWVPAEVRMARSVGDNKLTTDGFVVVTGKNPSPQLLHDGGWNIRAFPVSLRLPLPLVFSGGVLLADWLGIFQDGLSYIRSVWSWTNSRMPVREIAEIYISAVESIGGNVDPADIFSEVMDISVGE